MVAVKIATMARGGDRKSDQTANLQFDPVEPQVSRGDAAKMLNVSTRTVNMAAAVRDTGAPELIAAVEQGKVSVSAATKKEARRQRPGPRQRWDFL